MVRTNDMGREESCSANRPCKLHCIQLKGGVWINALYNINK